MKRAGIIFTGGTISMIIDQKLKAVIPGWSTQEIISRLTNIGDIAEIDLIELGPFPGPHVMPEIMLEIVRQMKLLLQRDDQSRKWYNREDWHVRPVSCRRVQYHQPGSSGGSIC